MENNHYFFHEVVWKKKHKLFSENWYRANNRKINIEKNKRKWKKKKNKGGSSALQAQAFSSLKKFQIKKPDN